MSKSEHIFDKTNCPSIETLKNYYLKELDKNEMREVELHLIDCEMCNDVLDGLAEMKHPDKTGLYTNEIEQKLNQAKTTKRNTGMPLKIAAAIAFIILAGGSIFLFNFLKESTSESMLGDNIQKEETGKIGSSGKGAKQKKSIIVKEEDEALSPMPEKNEKGNQTDQKETLAKKQVNERVSEPDKKESVQETESFAKKEINEEVVNKEKEEPALIESYEEDYTLYEMEKKEEPLSNRQFEPAMKSARTKASYQPEGSEGNDVLDEINSDSMAFGEMATNGISHNIEELNYLLESDPDNGPLLLELSKAYYNNGDYKKSLKNISEIVDLELIEYYPDCKILLEKIANESNKHWKKVEKLLRKME
jgi:hypothetical protein